MAPAIPPVVRTIVFVAAAVYLGICVVLFVFQRSLIYFPQPRTAGDSQSTMRLTVDGEALVVSVRPHAGPKAIVYFGGNAEDVSQNLAPFSEWFPDHALFLLHYRGYGGSTGQPTEEGNHRDAAALFRKVQAGHPDIVVIGRSLGSGVAVRLVSEQTASRLVLVTPYDSIEGLAAGAYPYFPVGWLLRDKYDSGRYASRLTLPTTLVVAERDEVIPRASTDKLFARFGKGIASMVVIRGVGHNTIGGVDEYRAALQEAVEDF